MNTLPARLSERDLIRAIGRPMERRGCACGVLIVARAEVWADIADAVYAHGTTPQHQAWREREAGL